MSSSGPALLPAVPPPRSACGRAWALALALAAALPACLDDQILERAPEVASCQGPEECPGTVCRDGACATSGCGDLQTVEPEECDSGAENGNTGVACRLDCTERSCGDGLPDPDLGELCDDANTVSGDGCSGDCSRLELCGDGIQDEGEACDDGNDLAGDGCRADCGGLELCGDGLVDPPEGCDDGDDVTGNGCDPDCSCGKPATAICVRYLLAAALRTDGAVFAWGRDPGVLVPGLAQPANTARPVRVPFGQPVVELACGDSFLAARTAGGSVLVLDGEAAPENFDGDPASLRPRELTGAFTAVASGVDHLLLLDADGIVHALGRNDHGQLGTGGPELFATEPVPVTLPGRASSIAAGWRMSLAILEADGSVQGWGVNNYWQLGRTHAAEERGPVPIGSLSGCDRIRASGLFAFARCGGSWWAWGHDNDAPIAALTGEPPEDFNGHLCRPEPVAVSFPFPPGELFPGFNTAYATDTDGRLWGWGQSVGAAGVAEWDLLGLGGSAADTNGDVRVPTNLGLEAGPGTAAAGGKDVTVVLLPDGSIHSTGLDSNGVLGNGDAITHIAKEWEPVPALCD